MKKLVLLLSIAAMIGCMALPVSAGIGYINPTIETKYQGTSLSDRAYVYVTALGSFRCSVYLVDVNGTKRGTRNYDKAYDFVITCHELTSYWVDHVYNNKSAECKAY